MPWWLEYILIGWFTLMLGPPILFVVILGLVIAPLGAACAFWSFLYDLIRKRI